MSARSMQSPGIGGIVKQFRLHRGLTFGMIIVAALIAFEMFNYTTTEFALSDLLGDLKFMGIRWATILAIAFCGIDFAGIARLFTPEDDSGGHTEAGAAAKMHETWYLFGAWLLAATMNAMLTWWGVSIAILGHETLGNAVISREMMLRIVPIFVAVMVWSIRVLIIGTFSVAGNRLFSQKDAVRYDRSRSASQSAFRTPQSQEAPATRLNSARTGSPSTNAYRPATGKSLNQATETGYNRQEQGYSRPEPTYHSLSSSAPRNASGANNSSTQSSNNRNGSSFQ